jgi:hypothetical protein
VRREGRGAAAAIAVALAAQRPVHHADGGCRRHRLQKLRPTALVCACAMMTQRQKLSKNKARKYSAVYLICTCRVARRDCPITCSRTANGCLRGATCQLRVLVGGAVTVTSGSSGVVRMKAASSCSAASAPLGFKTTGLGFNVHHANRAHRAQPSRHASLSARLTL